MKKTAIFLSLLASMLIVSIPMLSKSYEHPIVGATNTRTLAIAKVVTSDTATILHINATFRPKNWILIATDTYLQVGDKKLTIISGDGIELGKYFWMPDSGKASFILKFPPLPKGTKRFDFIESDCEDCFKIYNVELSNKKKYPTFPQGLPTEVRKYVAKDGALPNLIMERGTSQINFTLLGFQKGLAKELKVHFESFLQESQEHTLTIDQNSGTASLELDMFTSGMLFLRLGDSFYIGDLWVAPGEKTDFYIDLQQLTRHGQSSSKGKQTVYCTGTYRDLNMLINKQKQLLPTSPFQYYTKEFMDYKATADEYMNTLKSRYDAVLDSLAQRPELSQMVKEQFIATNKQQLIYATYACHYILQMNYRMVHEKWERNDKLDYTFAKTDESHFAQLEQWVDINDPSLLFGSDGFRSLSVLMQKKEKITNPLLSDILTAQPIMEKARRGALTDDDKTMLSTLHHSYISPLCIAANEEALKEIASLKKNPLLLPTPDVTKEKLFETIIAKHKGKVILVDFWNTWCGPCRSAMKAVEPYKTAELKSDKIVWIYIANETSPTATYAKMIKEIAGEHYRLNQEQWEYVCNQNEVDGIPFYVVVNPDGSFTSRPDLRDHNKLKDTLLEMIK